MSDVIILMTYLVYMLPYCHSKKKEFCEEHANSSRSHLPSYPVVRSSIQSLVVLNNNIIYKDPVDGFLKRFQMLACSFDTVNWLSYCLQPWIVFQIRLFLVWFVFCLLYVKLLSLSICFYGLSVAFVSQFELLFPVL
ncbi:hypothetical protein BD560DRAFT_493003 [Blakeslea trispora]|nr:hypothetical protein BD560DRAFT_493003 [Blakeslea trispora]